MELMDYLDSIDCSLEDFQAMLYEKQFGVDFEAVEESVSSRHNTAQLNRERTQKDKQLIQYTSCPLLAFLDGCTPQELDLGANSSSSTSSSHTSLQPSSSSTASLEAEPPSEFMDTSLESDQVSRSYLIRLEPLTEAEASEETLFHLCELSPTGPESDSIQQDRV